MTLAPHTGQESTPTKLSKDQLLSYYAEVCRSHTAITDFRGKLLALLPIATGTGIGLLATKGGDPGELDAWLLVALGILGAAVTIGLFFYEFHQLNECQQLRNHGGWIEEQLGLQTGQFCGQRPAVDLRHLVLPREFAKRDEEQRRLEVKGERPPDHERGLVNVRTAGYIVYGAVLVAWLMVFVRGLVEL